MPLAIDALKPLVWCTTTTTSTGTYRSAGARTGYRDLDAYTHGQRVTYAVRDGTNWEVGYGTVSITGTKDLSRDEIIESSQGNAAVNWPSGTKDLYTCAVPSDTVLVNRTNVYRASQDLDGNTLIMSADGTVSMVASSNTRAAWNAGSNNSLGLDSATPGVTVNLTDAGATAGPLMILDRNSASPAASDLLGKLNFRGRSSTGVARDYADLAADIVTATNGAEDGELIAHVLRAGTAVQVLRADNTDVRIAHAGGGCLIAKTTADGGATSGIEIQSTGSMYVVRAGGTSLIVDRQTNDGTLVSFQRGGVARGSISISGTTTSYNTTSDERLKEAVEDLTANDRRKLGLLRPVKFRWRETGLEDVGLIAQDVESVMPRLVQRGDDGYLQLAYSHGALIALLIGEVQQLRRELDVYRESQS